MARIKIDLDRRLGRIDRNIYGSFVEHLGRCIYGGIYEEGSHLSNERGFRQTIYWPLQLYATHAQPISLDAWVESDAVIVETGPEDRRFLAPLMPLPYLDVSATCDEEGQVVVLFVVNRHADEDIETMIQFTDFAPAPTAQVYEVNGPGLKAVNDFGSEQIRVVERQVGDASTTFTYIFPAHSITVMKLESP